MMLSVHNLTTFMSAAIMERETNVSINIFQVLIFLRSCSTWIRPVTNKATRVWLVENLQTRILNIKK